MGLYNNGEISFAKTNKWTNCLRNSETSLACPVRHLTQVPSSRSPYRARKALLRVMNFTILHPFSVLFSELALALVTLGGWFGVG